MLRTAPGRSRRSWVRSLRAVGRHAEPHADPGDQGDRGVDQQQPLPPDVRQRGATEQRAEDESRHADDDHHRHGPPAQGLVVEEPEDQRVGDRGHGCRRDAESGAQGDELAGGGDGRDTQAEDAEDGESDEQYPAASETVGRGARRQQQTTEGQRVRAGDPLQSGGAATEVAPDGGQRDRQQGVVDHFDEEGETQGGQRDPGGFQRRVGARGCCAVGGGHARSSLSNDVRLSNVVR